MSPEANPQNRESVAPRRAEDALPPVEPPNAGFIVQLFFIPLLIVSIIVGIWLMFSWIAQAGSNPRSLVAEMRKNNDASWQRAFELANLLRNSATESIKDDADFAKELCDFLEAEMKQASKVQHKVKLRVFLCRAIGQFHTDVVVTTLLRVITTPAEGSELEVQISAVEAIAVFVHERGSQPLAQRDEIVAALAEASRSSTENADQRRLYDELRSRAAFALGVTGSDAALNRLHELLDDSYPNTRFNATTGLARHGDPRAMPGLLEMLDPDNVALSADEVSDSEKANKRVWVLQNGIYAAQKYLPGREADSNVLIEAVEKLTSADVPDSVQLEAKNLLFSLRGGERGK